MFQGARAIACGRGSWGGTSPPPRWLERGGETVHRGLDRICGRERRAFTDKAAKLSCVTSPRTRPRRRGGRGCALPDARPRDSRRLERRPQGAEAARTVAEHVATEEVAGHGQVGRERGRAGAAGRGSCCGTGSRETLPSANKARVRPPRQGKCRIRLAR